MSSDDDKKVAAQCWLAGNKAISAENLDLAISNYRKSVQRVPENLMYRQSLRATQQRKLANKEQAASAAKRLLEAIHERIQKSRSGKEWLQVAAAAEEGLNLNPWDAQLNADLGDACRELKFNEVAVFAYEEAIKSEPSRRDSLAAFVDECNQRISAQPKGKIKLGTPSVAVQSNDRQSSDFNLRQQGAVQLPSSGQSKPGRTSVLNTLFRFDVFLPLLFLLYPWIPGLENRLFGLTNTSIGSQLTLIFIFSILAIGLNVVVGYSGLLHLGIAAFFGIGAYIVGILTVPSYPFQFGFWIALAIATGGAGLLGVVLAAPTLRLRGDYLALVTLGFGEVVRFSIRNLEEITAGTRGLNPVPPPALPFGWHGQWNTDFRWFYYLTLAILLAVLWLMRNLECSRLGRAWIAIREDELAATCMGINAARVKLSAFALSAALAGLAGGLYATKLTSTAGPDAFDFNRSMIMLCCIILGGLGSLRGTLLGVLILIGFDNVLAPILDGLIQQSGINAHNNRFLVFSNWRLSIFGMTLILIMRYRPMGLLPARLAKAA